MTHSIRRAAAALLTASLLVAGCGDDDASTASTLDTATDSTTTSTTPEPTFPVTVGADNGTVTIEEEPTAILSLSPSITEMLYAVGAGDQVAAVDTSSNFPPEAPVTDLSGFRPNVEAIGALEPDLVFLARDRDDVVATLEGVGVTVVLLEAPETLDEVYDQIDIVAAATGHAEEGVAVASQVEADIDELLAGVPERDDPLTYFYELTDAYNTLTSDTFAGAVLGLAGLENIADGVGPEAGSFPQLTAEYVLQSDPDVVFIAHSDGSVPTADEIAARPGWSHLTAVEEGHVVPLDPDIASRWGPRVLDLLEAVIAATAGFG